MIGKAWSTSFSIELFIYLLRFAAAEPSAPPLLRPQLYALARYYAAKYSAGTDASADSQFAAFLNGDFLAEDGAALPAPPAEKPDKRRKTDAGGGQSSLYTELNADSQSRS